MTKTCLKICLTPAIFLENNGYTFSTMVEWKVDPSAKRLGPLVHFSSDFQGASPMVELKGGVP